VSRRVALLCVLALALSAAGCGEDARDVLGETAANLGEIRSGRLDMSMLIEGRTAEARGGEVGFMLRGPFALPRGGGLPRARVAYTQVAGGRRATITVVSTGQAAFAEVGGRAYELPEDQAGRLRLGAQSLGTGGSGEPLRIGSWVRDPELTDGGSVGGAETERVSGRLDVATAAADLLRLSRALGPDSGAGLAALEQGGDELERSVRGSSLDLWTGKEDRLLRRLRIEVELEVEAGPAVAVRFELGVDSPNEPIDVRAPEDALPAAALPRG
jgi:hypothetical protein